MQMWQTLRTFVPTCPNRKRKKTKVNPNQECLAHILIMFQMFHLCFAHRCKHMIQAVILIWNEKTEWFTRPEYNRTERGLEKTSHYSNSLENGALAVVSRDSTVSLSHGLMRKEPACLSLLSTFSLPYSHQRLRKGVWIVCLVMEGDIVGLFYLSVSLLLEL